jgi:hypothetical protein
MRVTATKEELLSADKDLNVLAQHPYANGPVFFPHGKGISDLKQFVELKINDPDSKSMITKTLDNFYTQECQETFTAVAKNPHAMQDTLTVLKEMGIIAYYGVTLCAQHYESVGGAIYRSFIPAMSSRRVMSDPSIPSREKLTEIMTVITKNENGNLVESTLA